jgi:hypothetical protein
MRKAVGARLELRMGHRLAGLRHDEGGLIGPGARVLPGTHNGCSFDLVGFELVCGLGDISFQGCDDRERVGFLICMAYLSVNLTQQASPYLSVWRVT